MDPLNYRACYAAGRSYRCQNSIEKISSTKVLLLLQGLSNVGGNTRKNAEEREDIDALQNKLKVKRSSTVIH